jgi:hypothetical protein
VAWTSAEMTSITRGNRDWQSVKASKIFDVVFTKSTEQNIKKFDVHEVGY